MLNLKALLGAVCAVAAFIGAAAPVAVVAATPKSVAVTAIAERPAIASIRDGIRQALQAAGYNEGRALRWQYQVAQGSPRTADQIARKFVADRSDVIVAIGTVSTWAVLAATKNIPVVFAGVADPIGARLIKSWDPSGTNVTGVSDQLDLQKQIKLIKTIVPQARRVGVVYNPGNPNSALAVKQLQELLPQAGMALIEASAPRSVDVGSAARSLIGKVDLIYTNTGNNAAFAYAALVQAANDGKIPLIGADERSVRRGAIAALGVDYRALGVQAGKMVVRILKGEKVGAITPDTATGLTLYVNPAAAARQGVTLPDDLPKPVRIIN